MTEITPEHLTPVETVRGFSHLPAIHDTYGGEVSVYESSAASAPHVWLNATSPANYNDPEGEKTNATLHLPVADAIKLAEQLVMLVQGHYQGDIEPGNLLMIDVSVAEAATILNASTSHVRELLDQGKIAYATVGSRRPLLFSLLAYKRRDDADRAAAADDLTELTQPPAYKTEESADGHEYRGGLPR